MLLGLVHVAVNLPLEPLAVLPPEDGHLPPDDLRPEDDLLLPVRRLPLAHRVAGRGPVRLDELHLAAGAAVGAGLALGPPLLVLLQQLVHDVLVPVARLHAVHVNHPSLSKPRQKCPQNAPAERVSFRLLLLLSPPLAFRSLSEPRRAAASLATAFSTGVPLSCAAPKGDGPQGSGWSGLRCSTRGVWGGHATEDRKRGLASRALAPPSRARFFLWRGSP
mmetsp:Transcript_15502/g.39397  ORF Transcript_15502/g.39397 Transcript_15502/m.39397 type:complete len:220 (+) Transcript_15502:2525-3184(+)